MNEYQVTADLTTALFQVGGSFFVALSIKRLYDHKLVRGVHWAQVAFFSGWGIWNLYFYYYLGQPWSWWAGVLLAIVNTTWLFQMWYYIRLEHGKHILPSWVLLLCNRHNN